MMFIQIQTHTHTYWNCCVPVNYFNKFILCRFFPLYKYINCKPNRQLTKNKNNVEKSLFYGSSKFVVLLKL